MAKVRALLAALIVTVHLSGANAQTNEEPNTGEVYFDCLLGQLGAAGKGDMCAFSIWGFMKGYIAGADRGTATALIHDPEAADTTKGITDLTQRLSNLRARARCVPANSNVKTLVEGYMAYVKTHPEIYKSPFRETITNVMLVQYQCETKPEF